MTSKAGRIFAGFFAGLFLVTSSMLAVIVIYTMITENKQQSNDSQENAQQQSDQSKLTGLPLPGFTPTDQPLSKLEFTDTKPGTGETVKAGDTVTADYVGALMNSGIVFDASADHGGPQTFPLSQVIAGWSQGIPGMKVGGTRQLRIPAALGYGSQGQGESIPPNSDLVFNVTVVRIAK